MSVRQLSDTMLRLECDGKPNGRPCKNHHDVQNTIVAMNAASDWLERGEWRSIVKGNKQLHFCKFCSQRDARLNLNKRTRSAPQGAQA